MFPGPPDWPVNGVTVDTGEVFAHATGFSWDEGLLVLLPIVVVAALLLLANNRATQLRSRDEAETEARGEGAERPATNPDDVGA